MKRIWHHYKKWEEVGAGMWDGASAEESRGHLSRAIKFTGDAKLYGSYMRRVIVEWPFSCEHNLTDIGQNRKAWIGHAATALAIGCPEHITRQAWGHLSKQQQDDANEQAQAAIEEWENARKNTRTPKDMGDSGI